MNRREFLQSGALGLAGLTLSGPDLSWLINSAAADDSGPWKFGVMADSQWKTLTDPANPATCAIGIINALNQQFIAAGVRFVAQVGDLVDKESWTNPATGSSERTLPYRAAVAQPLYDAGIGFFPLRGNHEGTSVAANEFPTLFPQVRGEAANMFGVSAVVPSDKAALRGLSYAFDYGNLRIVMLDQFTRLDGSGSGTTATNNNMVDQVAWIDQVLADRPADSHALVMSHKNLIGQNHLDSLFGGDPRANGNARNLFIGSCAANRVAWCLGGHDHMHHRSLIKSPDSSAVTEQIICASNSYKFYIPQVPANDTTGRETLIAHELFTIGYYIFTVDGPCITVEYYSSSHGADYADLDLVYPPATFQFHLRERFGYSLNGQAFEIGNGEALSVVADSYAGTSARILDGINESLAEDRDTSGRALIKTVKTGWRPRPAGAASAVLKLWGLTNNLSLYDQALTGTLPDGPGPQRGDRFALALSYDATAVRPSALRTGQFCLKARAADGAWVNAVDGNSGGTRRFVYGPWRAAYGLGTYGVDPQSRTVWAVIDRDGDFVAG